MKELSQMRENYKMGSIDASSMNENPFLELNQWLNRAIDSNIPEPNAMILSTANVDALPDVRTVLLKGFKDENLVFYTNYNSKKASDIEANPNVAVLFLWKTLQQQIRIQGTVSRLSRDESVKYHASRPRKSQLGAQASRQSSVIKDRKVLEDKMADLLNKYGENEPIPCPELWGGYVIHPQTYEFWQGRRNRLHDRILYSKCHTSNTWKTVRLSP